MPIPTEGLINDGKLCIVDDQNDIRIVFTANQYGDTFLKFNGIDISGPDGGGSGTELTFNTLWSRVNPDVQVSDIEPTYENVDILPNGTDSNVGYDPNRDLSGPRWQGTFTQDLNITRDVYGHLIPHTDDTYDVGEPNRRWRNIYTNDLNLSNKSKTNDVDGTWGDYTIQEGEDHLFLINNRNGKKFRFMLEEVN